LAVQQVKNCTNHWQIFNFCKIPWQKKGKFRGLAQNSAARGKQWALMMMAVNIEISKSPKNEKAKNLGLKSQGSKC